MIKTVPTIFIVTNKSKYPIQTSQHWRGFSVGYTVLGTVLREVFGGGGGLIGGVGVGSG